MVLLVLQYQMIAMICVGVAVYTTSSKPSKKKRHLKRKAKDKDLPPERKKYARINGDGNGNETCQQQKKASKFIFLFYSFLLGFDLELCGAFVPPRTFENGQNQDDFESDQDMEVRGKKFTDTTETMSRLRLDHGAADSIDTNGASNIMIGKKEANKFLDNDLIRTRPHSRRLGAGDCGNQGKYYEADQCGWIKCAWGECKDCPSGKYSMVGNGENDSGGGSCRICHAGRFAPSRFVGANYYNTFASDNCNACPEGWKQPDEEAEDCEQCPSGRYSPASALSCIACSICNRGQYVSTSCTGTQNQICTPCDNGQYQSQNGYTGDSCHDWLVCGEGEYGTTPTAYVNRACQNCGNEQYQSENGYTGDSCHDWSMCGKGKYGTTPTTSADRQCVSCPSGQYQNSDSHTSTG